MVRPRPVQTLDTLVVPVESRRERVKGRRPGRSPRRRSGGPVSTRGVGCTIVVVSVGPGRVLARSGEPLLPGVVAPEGGTRTRESVATPGSLLPTIVTAEGPVLGRGPQTTLQVRG